MKLLGWQKNFKQGVFVTSHITGKNINLPILNNILIKVEAGSIKLISTNLELGIVVEVRGKIENEGLFTVDAKIFSDFISLMPNKKIELTLVEDNLIIEGENYQTKIRGQVGDEFPLIPQISKEQVCTFSAAELRQAISQVAFAVSADENRPGLNGILFVLTKDSLTLVGTDSYRLAEKKIAANNNLGDDAEKQIIIPLKTLQELLRIISGDFSDDNVEQISLYLSDSQVLFSFGPVEIVSRLIDERYPDYQQIIPRQSKTFCLVDKAEISRAVKTSAIFSKNGINDIDLKFAAAEGLLLISSASSQTGENLVKLPAKIEGLENSIAVNYRYLLDGLNNLPGDLVKLELTDHSTPCLLKSDSESGYLYIVMPIRQ